MATRIVIDRKYWVEQLNKICQSRIMSFRDLATDMAMHPNTIINFMDPDSKIVTNPKTLRIIDAYIKKNKKYLNDQR